MIIRMATIYGAEVGIDRNARIAAFVVVQFVGIPFTTVQVIRGRPEHDPLTSGASLLACLAISAIGLKGVDARIARRKAGHEI